MVGRLGATELASVGFSGVWMWTFFSFFYGTATGVQTFVSQADGADKPDECGPWAWQGAYAVIPATLVIAGLLGLVIEPLIGLLGPSAEMQRTSLAYVTTRLPGEVGMAALMVMTSFFRGLGDTRTPLYVSLLANVLNAFLDYALIFGAFGFPEWGVAGAGAATAVGQWSAAAALFFAFRRRHLRERYATAPVPPDARAIRRFLRTGLPIGGQMTLGMTSFAMFTTLIARMSDEAMAASQAFIILLSLSFMQAIGISVAASTLVGRYIGAQELHGAERSFWSSLRLGALLGLLIAALYVLFPETLLRIFTGRPGGDRARRSADAAGRRVPVLRRGWNHRRRRAARRGRHALALRRALGTRLGLLRAVGLPDGLRARGRPARRVVRRAALRGTPRRRAGLALPLRRMAAGRDLEIR